MKNKSLNRALWSCAYGENVLQEVLVMLVTLREKMPDEFNGPLVDMQDKINAAKGYLSAAKYNLLTALRGNEK